jgi:hypothetical protein
MFVSGGRLPTGGRQAGPNITPALLAATAAAALVGIGAVLLRHLKLSLEPGFADGRMIGEVLGWALSATALAAAALVFGVAPRMGGKVRAPQLAGLAAGVIGATLLAAAWLGFPSAEERMQHKVLVVAAQARDDASADIASFEAAARMNQWLGRLTPVGIESEQNLPVLRRTIAATDDVMNDYRLRLAHRRANIKTLLDVAARTPEDRPHVQALYDKAVGDLDAQQDRYWDLVAEAVNRGCWMVDAVGSLRAWNEAKDRGYPVRIDQQAFSERYSDAWSGLDNVKHMLVDAARLINRPFSKGHAST